jgi:hypothetical protein
MSEDLPRLKRLAASIRAEKAEVGNAHDHRIRLDVRAQSRFVPKYLDPSPLTPQSNANQSTYRALEYACSKASFDSTSACSCPRLLKTPFWESSSE